MAGFPSVVPVECQWGLVSLVLLSDNIQLPGPCPSLQDYLPVSIPGQSQRLSCKYHSLFSSLSPLPFWTSLLWIKVPSCLENKTKGFDPNAPAAYYSCFLKTGSLFSGSIRVCADSIPVRASRRFPLLSLFLLLTCAHTPSASQYSKTLNHANKELLWKKKINKGARPNKELLLGHFSLLKYHGWKPYGLCLDCIPPYYSPWQSKTLERLTPIRVVFKIKVLPHPPPSK